jgi:hypothetical protein
VPDKRFWWVAVRALSTARDWATLEQFAKSKKSPIGFRVRLIHRNRPLLHVPVLTVCRVLCVVSCRVVSCRVVSCRVVSCRVATKPFAEVCIEQGAMDEAAKYIAMLSDPAERVQMFLLVTLCPSPSPASPQCVCVALGKWADVWRR